MIHTNAAFGDEPHTRREGWLKNGNPPGDLAEARRCGAKRRDGGSCRGPAMKNGRCRMHGGVSTGPRTPEGLARSRRANWKHGACSADARRAHAQRQAEIRAFNFGQAIYHRNVMADMRRLLAQERRERREQRRTRRHLKGPE